MKAAQNLITSDLEKILAGKIEILSNASHKNTHLCYCFLIAK